MKETSPLDLLGERFMGGLLVGTHVVKGSPADLRAKFELFAMGGRPPVKH